LRDDLVARGFALDASLADAALNDAPATGAVSAFARRPRGDNGAFDAEALVFRLALVSPVRLAGGGASSGEPDASIDF
jgi:hypothetical protein